jgi:hypothetical protein
MIVMAIRLVGIERGAAVLEHLRAFVALSFERTFGLWTVFGR